MRRWVTTLMMATTLALAAFTASAGDFMPAFDVQEVVAEQERFRRQVLAGQGVFKDMPRSDVSLFESQQAGLLGILRGREYDDLDRDQRVAVFNHLEAIAAVVNRTRDSRLVCERAKPVGSRRVERVCKTIAQREREREEARDAPMMRGLNTCGAGPCAGE